MPLEWQIRVAQLADAEQLERLMQAAYQPLQLRLGGEVLPPLQADYAEEIQEYPCWLVEFSERIIGALLMSFAEYRATIINVAVDPQFHGQGIGGLLMRLAESAALEKKIDRLQLSTHRQLQENLSLYQYLGWREVERRGDKVIFEKSIATTPDGMD